MSKVEILSADQHSDLTIETGFESKFDDIRATATVIAQELPKLSLDYPVFITKNPSTGEFELSAVMGFSADENLFVQGDKWRASYVPMDVRRQPFQALILEDDNEKGSEQVKVGINVESNRVSSSGKALFNSDGSSTDFLNHVSEMLGALLSGAQPTKSFLQALADADLIEPVKLDVTFTGSKKVSFEGLYTVHSDKLSDLDDDRVLQFHKSGYLQACHAMIHSIGHIEKLIKWREQAAF